MTASPVRAQLTSVTVASALGIAVFYAAYSLIPIARADEPAVSSAVLGVMMGFVIIVQPATPALVRRFSVRTVLQTSLATMAVGVLLLGWAPGLVALLIGAAVAGAGIGVLVVSGAQSIGLLALGPRLSRELGRYGLVTISSAAIGAPLGVQLGTAASTEVFGLVAAGLCIISVVGTRGLSPGLGRDTDAATDTATDTDTDTDTDTAQPPSDRTGTSLATGLLRARWTLALMAIAIVLLSYGLTTLPVIASAAVLPAVVVLAVQFGNAVGRGVGGQLEPRIGHRGLVLVAGTLMLLGTGGTVWWHDSAVVIAPALMLGIGAGMIQTAVLHVTMVQAGPGVGSVLWNITIDSGLWLGGILTGLALARGVTAEASLVVAGLLVIVGLVGLRQLARHSTQRKHVPHQ